MGFGADHEALPLAHTPIPACEGYGDVACLACTDAADRCVPWPCEHAEGSAPSMRDRPLTPIEKGEATRGGYWCLQCNNAAANKTAHTCAGPVTVGGRRINCSCGEEHE